ncbi:MAG: hypothetical protein ACLFPN_05780, partial [Methanomassiliicoccales archaeon]
VEPDEEVSEIEAAVETGEVEPDEEVSEIEAAVETGEEVKVEAKTAETPDEERVPTGSEGSEKGTEEPEEGTAEEGTEEPETEQEEKKEVSE